MNWALKPVMWTRNGNVQCIFLPQKGAVKTAPSAIYHEICHRKSVACYCKEIRLENPGSDLICQGPSVYCVLIRFVGNPLKYFAKLNGSIKNTTFQLC